MEKMYKGIANSPESFLREKLIADGTILYLADNSILPEIPNLLVIGEGERAETVLVKSKRDDNGLNIQRAIEGNAIEWDKGTTVARNFTNYDYKNLVENISELDKNKANRSEIKTRLSEMTEDSSHRLVSDDEKAIWNNKAEKADIKTKLSQLTDDSTHRLVTDTEKATWNNKVDKVDGKGLSTNDYTNEDKSEVAKIKNKADKTYVDTELSGKATVTDLNKKIDKSNITSDLTGTDETKVLSQKAGSLLFQSVNDGKGYIANAIIDLDGDVEVSNESTFTELGDAITNNLKGKIKIYGFEIDENNSNPKTAVTYIGDNINHTPMRVSNYGSWEKFVKEISTPVLLKNGVVQYKLQHENFTKKSDGTNSVLTGSDGDVMIRFKHLWVKEEKVSSTRRKVYLSTEKFDGAVSHTKMTEKGYNQLSWGLLMTLQHLYLLLYKDRDSQTALGRGYVDGDSDFANTGGTNTKPYFFGETTGKQQMKFCGIESFWGNKYNWVDGIVSDSNYDLKIGYTNFNDSGSGYKLIKTPMTSSVDGYFKSTMGGDAGYILTDKNGSSSTGYCDYGYLYSGKVAHFGGHLSNGDGAGAFYVRLFNSASYSNSYIGARLCFLDDDYFYVGVYTGYVEGSKLRSISGKIPTGDKKIGEFRTYAQNNN